MTLPNILTTISEGEFPTQEDPTTHPTIHVACNTVWCDLNCPSQGVRKPCSSWA